MKTKLIAFLSLLATTSMAQTPMEDFTRDPNLAGSVCVAYPTPTEKLTPAPKGYTPVYFSHYGRHGSRFHIGGIYTGTYKTLKRAADNGKLTPLGLETMEKVRLLRDEAAGRDGELTPLGAEQHRQIAERMYSNFPEIFGKETTIDAKSTTVIRCILSMENAMQQLKSMNPKLNIKHDASVHDMYYMNQSDKQLDSIRNRNMGAHGRFSMGKTNPERLMPLLFNDMQYVKDSVQSHRLMKDLFDLAMNVQGSELRHQFTMTDLFTTEEMYNMWLTSNSYWYMAHGPAPQTGGKQHYNQRNLVRKIISEADSCLQLDNPGAHLRFGHDGMVLPLTCLLDLDGLEKQVDDLEQLAPSGWCDYQIIPMACNIQFIFYRAPGKPVLVKVLRNEHEARLPIPTDQWPYYRWDEVRSHYLQKLDAYVE